MRYEAPSRIHITLYDMNGDHGRMNGGMGFALDSPKLVFDAEKSNDIIIRHKEGLEVSAEMTNSIYKHLNKIKDDMNLSGVDINILNNIPEHSGFGSKTTNLITTAHALLNINGINMECKEIASLVSRGGTSGIGSNIVDKGGFIIDFGKKRKLGDTFGPSSSIEKFPIPKAIRFPMPEWNVCVLTPDLPTISGQKEIEFFKSQCPIASEDVNKLARITLSQLIPSIMEEDLAEFTKAINAIQQRQWKKAEIDIYGEKITNALNILHNEGFSAGLSSVGPSIYVVGNEIKDVSSLIKQTKLSMRNIAFTKPNNTGLTIQGGLR